MTFEDSGRVFGSSGRNDGFWDNQYAKRSKRPRRYSNSKKREKSSARYSYAIDLDSFDPTEHKASITQDELVEQKEKSMDFEACKRKMFQLLALKDFTSFSMQERLVKAGYYEDVAAQAVSKAVEVRLIDDKRYTELFISSRKEALWGKKKIEDSLKKVGISLMQIPGYPESVFPDEDEFVRAVKCLNQHRTTAKNKRESHYRFLISRGYSSSIAGKALENFISESSDYQ